MTAGATAEPRPGSELAAAFRRAVRWLPWLVLAVVVVVALGVGVHRHSPHQTVEQETMSIASEVRCPVCEGETVAQSSAALSVEIRDEIRKELLAGEKRSAILAGIVAVYGPGSLEKPQTGGIDLVLWVLPVVAVVVAVGGLSAAFVFWRPRRRAARLSETDRELVAGALANAHAVRARGRGEPGRGEATAGADGGGEAP